MGLTSVGQAVGNLYLLYENNEASAILCHSLFVIKYRKYQQIQLHHSRQNAKDPLFELFASTHQKYYSSKALHPYLPNSHPDNPVNRSSFNVDRETYWKERAEAEMQKRRAANIGSQTVH